MDNKIYFFLLLAVVICEAQKVDFFKIENNTKVIINLTEIRVCNESKPCLAKCCVLDEALFRENNITSCKRVKNKLDYRAIKIYDQARNETISNETVLDVFTIVHTDWFISQEAKIYKLDANNSIHYNNGELETERLTPGSLQIIEKLDYCIDFWQGETPIFRYRKLPENRSDVAGWLLSVATYITAFLMLLNFIIYCILPDLTITEMIRAAYVASMMLFFTFKASINLSLRTHNLPSRRIQFIAPITYFLILSSFSWLTMMSLDIWWTLRYITAVSSLLYLFLRGIRKNRPIHRKGIKHKFMVYCIYCYGFPALMTIAAVSVDFVPSIPREIKPIFEDFFTSSSTYKLLYYLHIPLLVLIIVNCVLFVMTVYNIWLVKRAIDKYNSPETSNTQENQYKFKIYLKLSLIMGISWFLDLIEATIWIPRWFMITVTSYHSLSGILIFYIFVCNKSIFRRLEKKLGIKLPGNYESAKNTNSVMTHKSQRSRRGPNTTTDKKVTEITTENNITTLTDVTV